MGDVITIGLDIAKSVVQIHGVDADGTVVIRKRVSRASWSSSRLCRDALWALRRVRARIIGAASLRFSAIR